MPVNIQNVNFTANGVFFDNKLYLDNDPGTPGQALISQGPDANVVWGDALGGGSMWVGGDFGANDEVFSSNDDVLVLSGANGIFTTVSNNLITITANTKLEANDLTNFSLSGQQQGDVLYVNGSNNWVNLPPGTAGQFLQTQGTGSDPTWATAAGGSFSFNITADVGSLDVVNDSDTVNYLGANGVLTTVTDNQIQIDTVGANGILITSDGINAANASAKVTVTASGIDIDDSQLSIATSQLTGDVVLGTQTSGSYVATVTGGAGLTGTGSGEQSTPTLAVGSANGIIVDADSVQVDGANGILVTADGVNVQAGNSTIFIDVNGIYVNTEAIPLGSPGDIESVTAGAGLTGGGVSGDVTLDIAAANTTIKIFADSIAANIEAIIADVNHDNLNGFVSTEHVDHTGVNIDSGAGLTGGGDITATRTLAVGSANGVIVDADSIQVDGANGILVTTDGVNVFADPADSTVVVAAAGISIDDSTISITASQITDDIALGTDTSGDYVSTISGTANEIEITGSGGEGSTPVIGIVTNPTLTGNVVITGDLTVSGNTTVVNSNNVLITDPLMELQHGLTGANPNDMGFIFERGSTGDNAVFIWDESEDKFTLGTTTADGNTASPITVTSGTLVADLEGSATDAAALTTDYVASFTAGTGLTGDASGVGSTPTINVVAANGIISDTDSVQIDGANGILVTTDGVNVFAGDATISVTASGVTVDESQLQIPTSSITSGDYVASFTAGDGLTGDASGTGSTPTIDVVAANTTIKVFTNSIAANIEAIIADVNHDNLNGFVSTEHVDHTSVTLTANAGLTGGGDISTGRFFNVGQGNGVIVDSDSIQIQAGNTILVTTAGINVRNNPTFYGNNYIGLVKGTTGEQPGSPQEGYFRYNVTTKKIEWWDGSAWTSPDTGGGEVNQFAWNTFVTDSGTDVVADNSTDTATLEGANGIFTVGDGGTDTVGFNVQGSNGILVTTDGVNVFASDATISVTSSGVSVDESQLQIPTSSITSGDYVASFTAGTGLTGDASGTGSTPTINVVAANGIISDTDSVQVKGANGILVTTDGVNAFAGDATISVTASGITVDESQLQIPTSSITSGDYVASFTAGNGLTGDASGTGSTPTINVVAANGIISDTDSVQVDGANGILVTTAGVNVKAGNNTIFVDADGVYVNTANILTSSANYIAYANTNSSVQKTMTAASSITFESNTAVIFQTYVISHGGPDASDQKAWILKGAIERLTNGTTSFVDTPSKEIVGETSGASSWDVALAVNTTANTFLDINVTGHASANVDWYSSSFIYPTDGPLNVAGSILRFSEVGAGGSFTFTIAGDVGGPDTVENSETVTYAGANGIFTTISDNQVQFDVAAANSTIKTFAGSLAVNTAALSLSTNQIQNAFLTYAAEVATNSTATLNEVLPVNSNTAPRTITTPSSPVAGNRFGVLDSRAKSAINNITVEFSASADNLNGASQDYILNENGASIIFRYLNADIGWVVENI